MSAKKTAAVWIVAGILFGYWWTVERVPASTKSAEIKRAKFLSVFRDDVTAIELTRDGKDVRAEKKEKRWVITRPDGATIPSDLVSSLVDNLTEHQDAEVVNEEPKPGDLAAFGLDKPRTEMVVELADGKKMKIAFGAQNPPRTAIYARSDAAPQIYLIGLNLQYYGDLVFQAAFAPAKIAS
ncbi:MAG: DUF4340 domain-containing protein [Candidatus Binatia bacterium]